MPDEPVTNLAVQIIAELGETEFAPVKRIEHIVQLCGPEFAQALLEETRQVEASGGLMTSDGKRRRTIGGVFFYLARGKMTKEQRNAVFNYKGRRGKGPAQTPSEFTPIQWDNRLSIVQKTLEKIGEVKTVKVTLIGRPKRVAKRDGTVVLSVEHTPKPTGYPKGVPSPPQTPTIYTVYIGAKQWSNVEETIAGDKEDVLIIEGQAAFDAEIDGIAVFTTMVTTKGQQQAKREAQKTKTETQE